MYLYLFYIREPEHTIFQRYPRRNHLWNWEEWDHESREKERSESMRSEESSWDMSRREGEWALRAWGVSGGEYESEWEHEWMRESEIEWMSMRGVRRRVNESTRWVRVRGVREGEEWEHESQITNATNIDRQLPTR
jgi:hypothetical protein